MTWVRRGNVPRSATWETYTVQSGDTLNSIASRFGVSVDVLKRINQLTSDSIGTGVSLKTYPQYTIIWGDILSDIAVSFKTTASELQRLNPSKIKNVSLIYSGDTIRVPVNESELPAAPTQAPSQTTTSAPEKPDGPESLVIDHPKTTGLVPPDDDYPPHRLVADEFYLRIGDCQFAIPPLNIQINKVSGVNQTLGLRQREAIKTKNGYTQTQIIIDLFFNGMEQINGFPVPAPDGGTYYMDGLRALIAQFKRSPFLPVVNEHLNNVHQIYNVCLAGLTVMPVAGFPECLRAQLVLSKMTVSPMTNLPDWAYDEQFMYPVFRWYYQQMIRGDSLLSKVYLAPMMGSHRMLRTWVLNEEILQNNAPKPTDPANWQEIPIPEDLYITSFTASLANVLTPMQMSYNADPTYQYLGGTDTRFSLTMQTTNKLAIGALNMVRETLERYARQYRNRIVTSYGAFENEILRLFGVTHCMIDEMSVRTVEGTPDLFEITLSLISYNKTRRANEIIDDQAGESSIQDLKYLEGDWADVATKQTNAKKAAVHEIRLRSFINTIELYPDLELPPIVKLNEALQIINDYRKGKSQKPMPLEKYESIDGAVYPDPDFYLSYPDITELPVDPDDLDMLIKSIEQFKVIKNPRIDETITVPGDVTLSTDGNGPAGAPIGVNTLPIVEQAAAIISSNEGWYGSVNHNDNGAISIGKLQWHAGRALSLLQLIRSYDSAWFDKTIHPNVLKQMNSGSMAHYTIVKNGPEQKSLETVLDSSNGHKAQEAQIKADVPGYIGAGQRAGLKDSKALIYFADLYNVRPASALPIAKKAVSNGGTLTAIHQAALADPYLGTMQYYNRHVKTYNALLSGNIPTTDGSPVGAPNIPAPVKVVPYMRPPEFNDDTLYRLVYKSKQGPLKWKAQAPDPDKKEEPILSTLDPIDPDELQSLVEQSTIDMRYYNRRGTMVRAYPSYIILLVDEGKWIDGRRLWNNYYAYHMISSIEITHEKNQPVGVAIVQMNDIYRALDFNPMITTKVPDPEYTGVLGFIDDVMDVATEKIDSFIHGTLKDQYHKWIDGAFPTLDEKDLADRNTLVNKLYLNENARIHIRMGYGSTATRLPVCFNGKVAEIRNDEIVTIVCQSDGAELVNPIGDYAGTDGKTNETFSTNFEFPQKPQKILYELLTERKDWWGDFAYMWTDGFGIQSGYGIEHFGFLERDADGSTNSLFNQEGYDLVKNIYSTGYALTKIRKAAASYQTSDKFFDPEPNVCFTLSNKSVWDIGRLLADVATEFIFAPHYHGFHSTLFFGKPHWYVKYDYVLTEDDGVYALDNISELYKPFQQFHVFDSAQDILANNIRLDSTGLTPVVAPVYLQDEEPCNDDKIYADPDIKPELQKVQALDTQIVQDFPMMDWILKTVGRAGAEAVEILTDAFTKLKEKMGMITKEQSEAAQNITDAQRLTNPGRVYAKNIGVSYLMRNFNDMYKGEIVSIGDPAVKAYDIVSVLDMYCQMVGCVEVGRVTHHMSLETGFITTVKPDLIAQAAGSERHNITRLLTTGAAGIVSLGLRRFLAYQFIRRSVDALPNVVKDVNTTFRLPFSSTYRRFVAKEFLETAVKAADAARGGAFTRMRQVIGRLVSVSAAGEATTGLGVVVAITELISWTLIDQAFDYVERVFWPDSAVRIYPLTHKNIPYVIGVDGARRLIPGIDTSGNDNSQYRGKGDKIPSHTSNRGTGTDKDGGGGGADTYYPVAKQFMGISSPYGWRTLNGSKEFHTGIDYKAVMNTPVHAFYDGEVVKVETLTGSFGKHIIIQHSTHPKFKDKWDADKWNRFDCYYTLYGHLNHFDVKKGDKVVAGQRIGYSGSTGRSTGAHLHFEMRERQDGKYFDPTPYIDGSRYPN